MKSNLGFPSPPVHHLRCRKERESAASLCWGKKCLEIGSNKIKKRYDEPLRNYCDWRSLLNIRHALILKHFVPDVPKIYRFICQVFESSERIGKLIGTLHAFRWIEPRVARGGSRRGEQWSAEWRDEKWETLQYFAYIKCIESNLRTSPVCERTIMSKDYKGKVLRRHNDRSGVPENG